MGSLLFDWPKEARSKAQIDDIPPFAHSTRCPECFLWQISDVPGIEWNNRWPWYNSNPQETLILRNHKAPKPLCAAGKQIFLLLQAPPEVAFVKQRLELNLFSEGLCL